MENNLISNIEIREKIRNGLNLAFEKLVAQKKKNSGVFVFSDQGKIIKVKAKDIKL
ncbi:hypothetical protein ACFOG5_07880 [Pedobacter fastidiosus]|uniref:Uncharacterized protein n=1 Tax=Pedobacter fastidiosus TaxID=2765361 RepID=A0ABR7KQ06_9SPHI|nr:hypothetical protein [Pedobacter fastidiosus]MBC6109925.1 hypothetical protein [Pedobacter fastidiosus]